MSDTVKRRYITWSLSEDKQYLYADVFGARKLDFFVPDFLKSVKMDRLEDVEVACFINGVKQGLSDKTAADKDMLSGVERADLMEATWKRWCIARQWKKPGEGRKTVVTKIDSALAKATAEELAVMLKLGLIDQGKYDSAVKARVSEAEAEVNAANNPIEEEEEE